MSFTNRKSHTGFRLVPTSVTLNGLIALILRFSPNSIALQAVYVSDWSQIYNVRKIPSPSPSLPLLANTNPRRSAVSVTAQLLVLYHVINHHNTRHQCYAYSQSLNSQFSVILSQLLAVVRAQLYSSAQNPWMWTFFGQNVYAQRRWRMQKTIGPAGPNTGPDYGCYDVSTTSPTASLIERKKTLQTCSWTQASVSSQQALLPINSGLAHWASGTGIHQVYLTKHAEIYNTQTQIHSQWQSEWQTYY